MKKNIWGYLCVCIILVLLPTYALADGLLAFEQPTYQIIPKKSITLQPIAQGIEEKLAFEWASSDDGIAKVSKKGKVTGVSTGKVTITCKGTTKSGEEYTAECALEVITPVSKIVVSDKKLVFPAMYRFSLDDFIKIEPEDATNQDISIESSNPDVVHVFDAGALTTWKAGSSTLTIRALDGSGVKATIKITVPKLCVSAAEITIADTEGCVFWYQINEGGYTTIETTGDVFTTESYEPEEIDTMYEVNPDLGKIDKYMLDLDYMLLKPIKAGNGKIRFNVNGRRTDIKVKVEHSAVIDDVSYPEAEIAALLEAKETSVGQKVSMTGTVVKKDEMDSEKRIVYAKAGDEYFSFTHKNASMCDHGETFTVYGILTEFMEYKTETGLTFECPFIEAKKVEQKK